MEEYIYKERKILRIYIWSVFVLGTIIILAMLGLISRDLITSHEHSDVKSFLIVATAGITWLIISFYCLTNSPANIVLTDKIIRVEWSSGKSKQYQWEDVKLKRTGPHEYVLILINDSNWIIPRWVLLDGSSKQYKELISRIRAVKHVTEIDWL
jgi:hypothetical protein